MASMSSVMPEVRGKTIRVMTKNGFSLRGRVIEFDVDHMNVVLDCVDAACGVVESSQPHQQQQTTSRIALAEQGVKQAEESHRVTSTQFKEGMVQNSDLLDAEVALLRAKTQYTQALVDYELAQARLQKAIGE